jgi:hypothetical protein
MGYYTEMKDPKNEGKTVDELKAIVAKNMAKDINYYHTEASFGVKGIGYTSEAPGAGIPKEPKGKYKSSGYGDMPKVVKEGQETRSVGSMVKPSNNEFKVGDTVIFKGTKQKITRIVDDRIYIKSEKYGLRPDTWVKAADLKKAKTNETLDEAKKRPAVSTEIKEIEKTNEALALEAKMKSIDEAIEKRQAKLKLAESEELMDMIDESMVKTLQKEIKELEKYKAKASKMYEKMTGSAKKEVIDEASPLIKETQDIDDFMDVLLDMAIENNIISSEDISDDRVRSALYDVWDKMGFDDYEETGQGISTSDYNAALEMFKNMIK